MSAPWKGWMRPMDKWGPEGDDDRIGVNRPVKDRREANYTTSVIVTPIDDESLPHPGDGKVWEWNSIPCEIMSVRGPWVWLRHGASHPLTAHVDSLRERKPEPEHKPWCPLGPRDSNPQVCQCERRSGEERRKRDRRVYDDKPNWDERLNYGRRSGTDRRSR